MKSRFSIIFALLFGLLFFSETEAQTVPETDKVPNDLRITLKKTGRFVDYTITVTADGNWLYQGYEGFPVKLPLVVSSIDGKPVKFPKYLKPKLSDEKLKLLIAEFAKIQFFKFGKDFLQEVENEYLSISGSATEVITIRINGQTKEVSNYLGDFTKRNRLLRDLAEKIRGAGVWNFENGKIPKDLNISYQLSYGEGGFREFTIKADGRVFENSYSNLPSISNTGKIFRSPKESELKNKLSKEDIKQIISEFEKVGFSAFTYKILTNSDGCFNENLNSGGQAKSISVQINNKNMYASIYKGCNAKPQTDAAKFEYIGARIEEILKLVKATKIN